MSVKKIIGIDERWEKDIPHNSKSKVVFDFLKEYDWRFCDDFFNWKHGGDGDNGELLMYQLDEYFDSEFHKQHDAEIRKPLEDEIESLKNKLADLTEEYELTVEGFDREYAKQNVRLGKAFNERNSERLKVITELEEWLYKQPTATYWLNDNEGEEHLSAENIKQKLNEMKEV